MEPRRRSRIRGIRRRKGRSVMKERKQTEEEKEWKSAKQCTPL